MAQFLLTRLKYHSKDLSTICQFSVSRLGLHELRSRLTIIPQDPILFGGTVRYNLDPEGKKSDSEIWDALNSSQIADKIREMGNGLYSEVIQGGENLSVGQRQLFCLTVCLNS